MNEELKELCRQITEKKIPINPYAFVNRSLCQKAHTNALKDALNQILNYSGTIQNPWGYLTTILNIKNGNYWEQENLKNHNNDFEVPDYLKELTNGIGKKI